MLSKAEPITAHPRLADTLLLGFIAAVTRKL